MVCFPLLKSISIFFNDVVDFVFLGRGETPLFAWFGVVVSRVLGLGVVVIITFAALWAPFCIYSDVAGGESCLSSLQQASGLTLLELSLIFTY